MKQVVIINRASNAALYGVGTYIEEYGQCLVAMGIKVYIVEMHKEGREVEVKENLSGATTINIPITRRMITNFIEKEYCLSTFYFIKMFIEDSPELLFHFNYSSYDDLIKNISEYYQQAKKIFTVHYYNWSESLKANVSLFKELAHMPNGHKIPIKYKPAIKEFVKEKELFELMDHVICLCEDSYDILKKVYGIREDKLHLIQNGLRDEYSYNNKSRLRLREKFHVDKNEFIVLFVGRLAHVKGIDLLLDAFNNMDLSLPCRLVVVGDGDYRYLKRIKRVWTKITFTGRISKNDVYNWYKIADIGVFPSLYEECSYVGMEMMMHGLPVLATDSYSVNNMFKDGYNAITVPIESDKTHKKAVRNISEAIKQLLYDSDMRIMLGKNARKEYENLYTIDKMRENYQNFFIKIWS